MVNPAVMRFSAVRGPAASVHILAMTAHPVSRPRTPRRVQRRFGIPSPAGTAYVGLGTQWETPFRPGHTTVLHDGDGKKTYHHPGDEAEAVEEFRAYASVPSRADSVRDLLSGLDLACWCEPGVPCHADVLLEIAAG